MTTHRSHQLFASATEMSERHLAHDWNASPMGPPGTWPASLRTLVPLMLSSRQPMFIVWGEARTLLYNDPYAEILGSKHPDALGRDFLEVWHEIRGNLEPIVAAAYRGEDAQMADTLLWLERRGFREETHFSFFFAPLRDDSGAFCGLLCACTEITQQVLSERRLAKSEARHRGVLDNMDEGFTLLDERFTILEVNDEAVRIVGLPRGELVGRNYWERFAGSQDSELGRVYQAAMAQRRSLSCEYAYRFPDGRAVWVDVRAFPVDEGLAILFRDISEQRAMMKSLRQADQRKDEFLAMLAHELRNPLAPIKTATHILKLGAGDPHKVSQASAVIERQAGHLERLIDDLLDVSRVTRGLVRLERAPVDLRNVLSVAAEQSRELMQARKHWLRLVPGGQPLMVHGDFHRLVQVLSNLLNNAAKYTPPGGRIEVRLAAINDSALIEVTDNGEGIDADLIAHVFDLFMQGQRTPDRAQGGLGIGLALVRRLVEMHGGRVCAEPRTEGPGTTFRVTLPLSRTLVAPAADPAPRPLLGRMRHVLVVDDNQDAGLTLADALKLVGCTVATAHDASTALQMAANGTPWDAFILDIGMPDMSGYELVGKLRELGSTAGSLFIALTGYGQAHDHAASIKAGFDHHLVKPADLSRLLQIIKARPVEEVAERSR